MARPSIALTLSLSLAVGTALLWIGAASISATVMQHELNEAFDETLRQSAYRLLPLAIHDLRELDGEHARQVPGINQSGDENYFTYYVRDRSGQVLVRGDNAPEGLDSINLDNGFSEIDGKRLFAATDERSGFRITIVETSEHREKALGESIAALAWPLLALFPLIVLFIWGSIRLAMRPVERLRRDIESRDSQNLEPLHMDGHPVELAPIAQAVASLIERLKAAMDAERAFAASSAHELRTPIAGALAQTQQLAQELGSAPGYERLSEIETALKNLAHLAEKLLQLSRLEAGFARVDQAADLMPVVHMVVRDFQSASKIGQRLQFSATAEHLSVAINLDAFAIALTNLLQNAAMHGDPAGPIVVSVAGRDISVANGGAIVPDEVLARLGRPFLRGKTSASGSGLGLSIARSIMAEVGGDLIVVSPAAGKTDGFQATLRFARP